MFAGSSPSCSTTRCCGRRCSCDLRSLCFCHPFFLPLLMVDHIYIYMGSSMLIIILLFWTVVHCCFCALSFRSSSVGPPLSMYPRFQVAQPWKLNSPHPVDCASVPGRLYMHYHVMFKRFDDCSTVRFFHGCFPLAPSFTCIYSGGL